MYHGVLPVHKEAGMTSHDVVFKVRKILKMKKVGHTGTLDPDVTGVLPIVLGDATKLTEYMQTKDKSYRAEVTLGIRTDTGDASGTVTEQKPATDISSSKEPIDEAVRSFTGEYQQQVPLYSSVKVEGKKLYEYARENIPVERPVKHVEIRNIERVSAISYDEQKQTVSFYMDVTCSKGTYIRTLAEDISESLGVPGHMSDLVRTASCGFGEADTCTLDDLRFEADMFEDIIRPIDEVIQDEHLVNIEDEQLLFKIRNGQKLYKNDMMNYVGDAFGRTDEYIVFEYDGKALAMYHEHPEKDDEYKPYKMFTSDN